MSPTRKITTAVQIGKVTVGGGAPIVVQSMNNQPRVVYWRDRRLQFVSIHGPERLSGDWWRADGFARDYWRCTVAGEGDVLMYRDANGWFLQGWYD